MCCYLVPVLLFLCCLVMSKWKKIGSFCVTGRSNIAIFSEHNNLPLFLAKRRKIFCLYFLKCLNVWCWSTVWNRVIVTIVLCCQKYQVAYPVGGVKESVSKPKLTVYDYYPTKTDSTQQSKVIHSFIVRTRYTLCQLVYLFSSSHIIWKYSFDCFVQSLGKKHTVLPTCYYN